MTTLLSRSAIDDDPAGGTRPQGSPVASQGQVPAELLIVTQWYRPELIGTAFYSAELAEWFASRGSKVTVLTNRPNYPGNEVFPEYRDGSHDRETLEKVAVRRLPTKVAVRGKARARIVAELFFLIRGVLALASGHVRRQQTVVSFCPSVVAVLLGWLARKRGGCHVAIVHDIQSGLAAGLNLLDKGYLLSFIRMCERFCLNRADHVMALSEEMREALQGLGVKSPIAVLPIWVDTEKIYPLPRPEGAPPTLLYSGNLGRKQGLGQLLDLAEVLQRERPEVRILIRGNGSQGEILKRTARERGLANLRFEPLMPPERFNESLAEGDVHLIPQDPEAADFAVPSKVYSIMAAGRPCVATAKEGSTLWKLAEKTGACFCVPPGDPRACADAVIALLEDPDRRAELGRNGRAYVEDNVARDNVLPQLTDHFQCKPSA